MVFLIIGFSCAAVVLVISAFFVRLHRSRKWINLRRCKEKYNYSENLHHKTILITGANEGLGYQTALDLSRRNVGTLILACRDLSEGLKAISSITKITKNHNMTCLEIDLASIKSIQNFVTKIKANYEKIDVLICNAGVYYPMNLEKKTEDGYEIHFGVNHLGHAYLVKSLMDKLSSLQKEDIDISDDGSDEKIGNRSDDGDDKGGRIVFVSSSFMKQSQIDLKEEQFHLGRHDNDSESELSHSTNGKKKSKMACGKKYFTDKAPTAYCDSKLMNALTCQFLACEYLPPHITTYTVDPGFSRTKLGRYVSLPFSKKLLLVPLNFMLNRTAKQGAQNIMFATIVEKDALVHGGFYRDGKILEKEMEYIKTIGGVSLAKQLWEVTEELINKHTETV